MRYLPIITALIGFGLAFARADAQQPSTTEDRLYRVEVILFAHNDGNPGDEDFHHGSEMPLDSPVPTRLGLPAIGIESLFDFGLPQAPAGETPADPAAAIGNDASPPDEPGPLPADGLELIEPFADRASAPIGALVAAPDRLPPKFRALTPSELELGDVVRRFGNLTRVYRVLAHAGWEQSGVDTDRSVPLDLRRLGITNPTGTIELYLRRFLHVALDLDYFAGDGTFWSVPAGPGLAPFVYAERFTLATERNAIRSGELHYIDHPMLGVLVLIRPAPEPEASGDRQRGPAG